MCRTPEFKHCRRSVLPPPLPHSAASCFRNAPILGYFAQRDPWALPSVRAKVVYCARAAVTIALCSLAYTNPALAVFTPGILVPLAAVRLCI